MRLTPHLRAVLQALLVAFLWSTSWVLIKIGLQREIPPLTFAGLRYTLAFLCLLPFFLRRSDYRTLLKAQTRRSWMWLLLLGLLFYTATQGAQFVGLALLPAATVNLLLACTAVVVALFGIRMLAERPTALQWGGMGLYLVGVAVYFYPAVLAGDQIIGILVVSGGVLANAGSALLGRAINREGVLPPLIITTVSMGIGAVVLLAVGIATQGMPILSITEWLIIAWLALVNTAFAFTLWNHTLRTLTALESSLINNTMLIQIPLLAWVFLGEALDIKAILALVIAGAGILIVQLRRLPFRR
ncbi:MAG: DMT family transporter [Anaerolineaceae bacterium]|nr:DMT family transporter [Anaerolineaceae bacterium]